MNLVKITKDKHEEIALEGTATIGEIDGKLNFVQYNKGQISFYNENFGVVRAVKVPNVTFANEQAIEIYNSKIAITEGYNVYYYNFLTNQFYEETEVKAIKTHPDIDWTDSFRQIQLRTFAGESKKAFLINLPLENTYYQQLNYYSDRSDDHLYTILQNGYELYLLKIADTGEVEKYQKI